MGKLVFLVKQGETVRIGDNIKISYKVNPNYSAKNKVAMVFEAPEEVKIFREKKKKQDRPYVNYDENYNR